LGLAGAVRSHEREDSHLALFGIICCNDWWHLVQKLFDPKPQNFPPVVQQRYDPLRFTPGPEGVSNIRINVSDALVTRFEQRAAALYKALKDKDADAILILFKGKCLYSTMQRLLQKEHGYDLPEPAQWYLQLRASKDFEAVMSRVLWLSAFRTKIKDFLAG
jgi:hypothetical protein